jgi:segregation and condensation protein B
LVIEDIRGELRGRPYDLVAGAGRWHLTCKQFADAIHLAMGGPRLQPLSRTENLVLTAIGYFQPVTRGELSQLFGKEVSRDIIGQLRGLHFIAAGPRSPQPGAPLAVIPKISSLRPKLAQYRSGQARSAVIE